MKIVILDGYTENPGDLSWSGFEQLGSLTIYDRTPVHDEAEIRHRIGDAEIVITNKTPLTAETIRACPNIQYIGLLSTGYNIADIDAARQRDIPVCNIPSYSTQAVAQFTIGLLLEICHRIGDHSRAVFSGKWQTHEDFCFWDFPLIELQNKTMGIIGFGRIGQAVARIAAALGMQVIAYSRSQTQAGRSLAEYVSFEELLERSDVISLHCPLLPETQGLINRSAIHRMKNGVIVLNTSRGPVIVEQDLADALNSGKVYAAGLDVVSVEPIDPDNPLLRAKNCIITPHIAWAPKETRARLMEIAAENLRSFLAGKPVNVVNPQREQLI